MWKTKWTRKQNKSHGQTLQSVRFGLTENKKSCPANALEVGVQSTECPMTKVDKPKLDGVTLTRRQ